MDTNRPHITPQGFVGVFIVLLGIVFTLDNLGLVKSREVLQYWPLAPIGIGLLIVIHANETRDWIRGSVWLGAGILLLASNLGWLHFEIRVFWPLLLVFFGLHIIFKAREDPADRLERRADQLRRRQERWQRKAQRWQARHPGQMPPWSQWRGGDWGAEWTKQWTDKWNQTQAQFQEDWQDKFHERFHEDWQDKLKRSIQNLAGTGDHDHDVPIDVDVHVSSPDPGVNPGTSGAPASGPAVSGGSAAAGSAAGGSAAGVSGSSGAGSSAVGSGAAGSSAASASGGAPGYSSAAGAPYTGGIGGIGGSGFGGAGTSAIGATSGYASGANAPPYADSDRSNSIHKLSLFAFMAGVIRKVRNAPFYGGNLTAVMGGIELDLRQAHLPEDAVIELFAFWGGIEIWVPREWNVVNQGFALMGSIEDKTGNLPQRPGQPRVVLRGMALMGGVEIKN
jgi:hypothetical protein